MNKIPTPPWTGVGKRIESAIRKALYDFQMVADVSKLGIALSGGKDSMTLLAMLKAISGRGFHPFELYAFHVNGEFSCGAGVGQGILESFCESLNVPLLTRTSTQKLESLECYNCSRERRTFLFEMAKSVGCTTVAFGHHRDDNAQTLMMNLLQKGEFAGLQPKIRMIEYGVTIIRPMIYIEEEAVRTFSQIEGFARVSCRCPVGQNSMRRQVDVLLNEIEHVYPHARENIANASLVYGSDKALRISKKGVTHAPST